ncbi:MAG: hypothetical protein ABRQ39_30825, partial [Candidatus Eremiobacterota bacterium]
RTYPKSNIYCTPFRGVRLWRKIYTVLTVICKLSKCNIVAVCNNSFFCTRIIDFSEESHPPEGI